MRKKANKSGKAKASPSWKLAKQQAQRANRGSKKKAGSARTKAASLDAPHILHLHSTFSAGGKELRSVQLMNAFGGEMRHSIVSGVPDAMGAAAHIKPGIAVDFPADFPALSGRPTPKRMFALAKAMAPYDLVLTYNWGAMDAAMAHTLLGEKLALPPLIHHEDGFNDDERNRLKKGRNWYRRIGLGRAAGLVVPSERLEEIALDIWEQPMGRVKLIHNAVATKRFAKAPRPDALRGVVKHKDEFWVGTMAGLRPVKNLRALVRAFVGLPETWQLVIVGEGPERNAIRAEADRLNITHRLHMPGFASDPAEVVGLFDIFALSSNSEQFPISVLEAMAAGLPVAAPAVGDVASMVSEENAPFITAPGDEAALAKAIADLAQSPEMRAEVGKANQAKARAEYDDKDMIAAYRRLYTSALTLKQP